MGYQTNPIGLRLIKTRNWESKWSVNLIYNKEVYAALLHEDLLIKRYLKQICLKKQIELGKLIIKRSFNQIYIILPINYDTNAEQPLSINKIENNDLNSTHNLKFFKSIQHQIENFTNIKTYVFVSNITTIATSAELIATTLARLLTTKRRISAYQLSKKIKLLNTNNNSKIHILGYKVQISGRLNRANRACTIQFKEGRMPLTTVDLNKKINKKENIKIDYASSVAYTKYGTLGIKVWNTHSLNLNVLE